ncbi:ras family protein, partial [Cystoisospora suis]
GEEISLHFWNISGKAVFTDIAREFFKESDAVVLVFDVTSRSSFESLPRWLDLLQPYLDDRRFSLFLCGNKSESCKRVIEEEEGKHWAFSNGFPYYEVSANTGRNLESLFYNILVSLPLITSKI